MARYESYLHYAASIRSEWEQLRDEGRDVRRFLPDVERLEKAPWSQEIENEALALGEEIGCFAFHPTDIGIVERYNRLAETFRAQFGREPELFVSAPGRTACRVCSAAIRSFSSTVWSPYWNRIPLTT